MMRIIVQLGKSKMILAFIVGIGFVIGYLSYSGLDIGVVDQEQVVRGDDIESFRGFKLDFSILNDERYKSLDVLGDNPVEAGITGEIKNPFIPL